MADAINSAVDRNVSVVIASGNNGWTDGITDPACIQNATPIGAVTSTDGITYNRGTLLSVLAPGTSITSTESSSGGTCGAPGGDFGDCSGTSMSTPHVAGAFALFHQYWNLAYALEPTPSQIELKLSVSGKSIDDTSNSGKNYSRTDVLVALQPYLNFTSSSLSNASTIIQTHALINITSDVNLSAPLLQWTYSNGTIRNYTMTSNPSNINYPKSQNSPNVAGFNYYYNLTNLPSGNHSYKVYGNDTANLLGTSSTRSVEVDNTSPTITFNSPTNNSFHNSALTLNISLSDSLLSHSNYSITNSSNSLLKQNSTTSKNSAANINSATFTWTDSLDLSNSTFPDGNYTLAVWANDSLNNIAVSTITLVIDKTSPSFSSINISPSTIYNNDTVTIRINITDLYLNTSTLFIQSNFSGTATNYTLSLELGGQENRYNYTIN
ncbi:S8 family serine peptidase [Candidatus Woesearchaeota archaeon]|nr:S8 family serine peptidase [Candidatus Woesearchaeota archaeon]